MKGVWKDHYRIESKNDKITGSSWCVTGFETIEEAKHYAREWEYYNIGYSPIATVTETNDSIKVYCRLSNSCD